MTRPLKSSSSFRNVPVLDLNASIRVLKENATSPARADSMISPEMKVQQFVNHFRVTTSFSDLAQKATGFAVIVRKSAISAHPNIFSQ